MLRSEALTSAKTPAPLVLWHPADRRSRQSRRHTCGFAYPSPCVGVCVYARTAKLKSVSLQRLAPSTLPHACNSVAHCIDGRIIACMPRCATVVVDRDIATQRVRDVFISSVVIDPQRLVDAVLMLTHTRLSRTRGATAWAAGAPSVVFR